MSKVSNQRSGGITGPDLRPERLTRAHVLPLAVFMGFMVLLQLVGGSIEWKHPDAPWWRQDPAQFVYPLQTLVALGILLKYWRCYAFDWSWRWSAIGVVFGVVGIGLWLLPTTLYDSMGLTGKTEGWLRWLGVAARKDGFDPGLFENPVAYWFSLSLRIFRAAVVVALVEEIFWRGFLMRFLADWEGDYWRQPFGKASWLSYGVVTGMFVMAHGQLDWAGALVYGSLTYGLCVWSKNLGACVVMHATANLLMGIYIMAYGKYGLW
jgi:CAAX prenyl protease-like protein